MGYKKGIDRDQLTLLPPCLDGYVPEDHICRVIVAFTNLLDMVALGFKYAECKSRGNNPYDPRMMLNLFIYGYLYRIRSSRCLEAETHRNIEVMWLMAGLTPDDRTICNFRKDNAKALRSAFRSFNKTCKGLGLFGGDLTAVDGTKFRANNSRKNNHNKKTVDRELSFIDKKITEYLNVLEESDSIETNEVIGTTDQIKEAINKLTDEKEKLNVFEECLETESEISTVDTDSRLMHSGGDARPLDVCYNVQTIVDAKHNLIVDFDVTDRADDKGNLSNMCEKASEVMGVDTFTVLADKGYYDGEDIASCEEKGFTCLVAKPNAGGAVKGECFKRDRFVYDDKNDCYICPCGKKLTFKRIDKRKDGKEYRVYNNYSACKSCAKKCECTDTDYRNILRLSYQDKLDVVDKRTKNDKALYKKRSSIVEHPFGTIKHVWGFKHFLCRGKEKVSGEISLSYLCYNFRRVFNIYGGRIMELIKCMAV